jgi:hypothetical protein
LIGPIRLDKTVFFYFLQSDCVHATGKKNPEKSGLLLLQKNAVYT